MLDFKMPLDRGFGVEWKDDLFALKVEAILNWTLGLLSIMILAYNLQNPSVGLPATFVAFLSLTRGVLALFEWRDESHPVVAIAGFGSKDKMIAGGIAGLILGFLFASNAFSIIGSLAIPQVAGMTLAAIPVDFGFVFVVLLAPLSEELFFRGILLFTFNLFVRNMHVAAVIVSGVFALFHYVAYAANPAAMTAAFVASMLFIYLNFVFQSLAPSTVWHMVWNYSSLR